MKSKRISHTEVKKKLLQDKKVKKEYDDLSGLYQLIDKIKRKKNSKG